MVTVHVMKRSCWEVIADKHAISRSSVHRISPMPNCSGVPNSISQVRIITLRGGPSKRAEFKARNTCPLQPVECVLQQFFKHTLVNYSSKPLWH